MIESLIYYLNMLA